MNKCLALITSTFVLSCAFAVQLAEAYKATSLSRMHDATQSIDSYHLKEHVDILSDDTFEGRAAGTRGGKAAAGYLREALDDIGVEPVTGYETLSHPFRTGCQTPVSYTHLPLPPISSV